METNPPAIISPEERDELRKQLLAQLEGVTYKGWIKPFLKAYAETGIIGLAAKAARIERRTVEKLREKNAVFFKLMEMSKEDATDLLEGVARNRAINGNRELVLHHGKPVKDPRDSTGQAYLYKTKVSDNLLVFLLKKYRYPDQVNHTHTGPGGGPIQVKHALKDDALTKKLQQQIAVTPQRALALPPGPVLEAETDDAKIVSGEDEPEELKEIVGDDE